MKKYRLLQPKSIKKKQEEINERIKAIVKHYERSAEEAAKHYVRF